ncbi:hypothetical protein P7K49_006912 [Saguinus oedipus]|uniref:Uncharacterized protein n=1 Tax=Saguinus oedipus TaxID=9490 RepID=A0ABQ9W4K3_SAGOE|nr:hypothetical protein P7K49_006912 [Saguinus oedipus]
MPAGTVPLLSAQCRRLADGGSRRPPTDHSRPFRAHRAWTRHFAGTHHPAVPSRSPNPLPAGPFRGCSTRAATRLTSSAGSRTLTTGAPGARAPRTSSNRNRNRRGSGTFLPQPISALLCYGSPLGPKRPVRAKARKSKNPGWFVPWRNWCNGIPLTEIRIQHKYNSIQNKNKNPEN